MIESFKSPDRVRANRRDRQFSACAFQPCLYSSLTLEGLSAHTQAQHTHSYVWPWIVPLFAPLELTTADTFLVLAAFTSARHHLVRTTALHKCLTFSHTSKGLWYSSRNSTVTQCSKHRKKLQALPQFQKRTGWLTFQRSLMWNVPVCES